MPRRFDPREPLRDSVRLLGLYVRGRILLCFSLAVLYAGGFWAIHVPYWIVIGPLGGMASLIPSVGSLVPVGLAGVAFLTVEAGVGSYLRLLGVWILVLAIEMFVLVPRLIGRPLGLRELPVLAALLVGSLVFGPIGLLLAVPVLAVGMVFWRHWRRGSASG